MRDLHMKKGRTSHKVLLCTLLVSFALILLTYLGFVFYFSNHFFFHTEINGIDVSCKTTEQVNEILTNETNNYSLTIYGRNEVTDSITAQDIMLTYTSDGSVEDTMEQQNAFLWITGAFRADTSTITNSVTYDEQALDALCDSLAFFQKENIVSPTNATVAYLENEGYSIVSESHGATLKRKDFLTYIHDAIISLEPEVTLDNSGCYKTPTITSDSEELVSLLETAKTYASTQLTYQFGKDTVVLDSSKIKNWLKINNKKYKVSIRTNKVKAFVKKLASKYNTYGRTRTFKASTGNQVSVSGGNYGWLFDQEKETKQIIKCIKKGAVKNKKPSYTYTAASHSNKDWGKTYVEINLTAQHLWFYKKGKLVIESDFVSGNVSRGNGTPQGVYYLLFRERDAILGERSNADYRTPVSFWMPFNRGIGMHDATWRSKFGGTIYQNGGSHGCINLPYSAAETIFNEIESGTPVVCYYDFNYHAQ